MATEKNLTILIAEDDVDDQELLKNAFTSIDESFNLLIVENGQHVLEYLEKTPKEKLPCLIVLDYNMPGLNGGEVLQLIGNDEKLRSIPKVVLSTSSSSRYVEECYKNGADAYRVKPSNFTALISIAKEMLEICKSAA